MQKVVGSSPISRFEVPANCHLLPLDALQTNAEGLGFEYPRQGRADALHLEHIR
jgi:hypothetical protein